MLLIDIMFHYLPLYNKFRTVEMALVIPGLVFPVIAIWGLKTVFSGNVDDKEFKRCFLWSLGITGGICLNYLSNTFAVIEFSFGLR